MKKAEKTQETKKRILAAALEEFGSNDYETASINVICNNYHISKGLLYHNYKSKDDLYLACVKVSYDALLDHLKRNMSSKDTILKLEDFISLRQCFFENNSYHANIFFDTILHPPVHLVQEIKAIRKEFDEYCTNYYRECLACLPLKDDISEDIVLDYLAIFQEVFNRYFYQNLNPGNDQKKLIIDHEHYLLKIVDIMLYGIVKKENENL